VALFDPKYPKSMGKPYYFYRYLVSKENTNLAKNKTNGISEPGTQGSDGEKYESDRGAEEASRYIRRSVTEAEKAGADSKGNGKSIESLTGTEIQAIYLKNRARLERELKRGVPQSESGQAGEVRQKEIGNNPLFSLTSPTEEEINELFNIDKDESTNQGGEDTGSDEGISPENGDVDNGAANGNEGQDRINPELQGSQGELSGYQKKVAQEIESCAAF
jgi:hypothetical protein